MDVRELRLGNYVHNNVENFQLEAKDLMFLLSFDNEHYANPLDLTREWFDRFVGFENKQGDMYYSRFKFRYLPQYNYWYVTDSQEKTYMTKIEHVHELQNFIRFIDGKELEICKQKI